MAYYLMRQVDDQTSATLTLPLCQDTLLLIEKHKGNLRGLAERLCVDEESGTLFIKETYQHVPQYLV